MLQIKVFIAFVILSLTSLFSYSANFSFKYSNVVSLSLKKWSISISLVSTFNGSSNSSTFSLKISSIFLFELLLKRFELVNVFEMSFNNAFSPLNEKELVLLLIFINLTSVNFLFIELFLNRGRKLLLKILVSIDIVSLYSSNWII